jgi:hypothetical protein
MIISYKRLKHKVITLSQNPVGVYTKYGIRFWGLISNGIISMPKQPENYDLHWNYLNFKDKTVLDLGADYGSTARYFRKQGARQVIAVEGDPALADRLKHYSEKRGYIVPIEKWICSATDISALIDKYSPDIVKVDIEGAESNLLHCSDETLRNVAEWMIETHGDVLHSQIFDRFLKAGFRIFNGRYYWPVLIMKRDG